MFEPQRLTDDPRNRLSHDLGPVVMSLAVVGVWAALALRSPTVTYHFAPALATAAWPVGRRVMRGCASFAPAVRVAGGGLGLTVLVTVVLARLDALRGPVLVGGNATGESLLFAAVAAIWGMRVLTRSGAGLVVRILSSP